MCLCTGHPGSPADLGPSRHQNWGALGRVWGYLGHSRLFLNSFIEIKFTYPTIYPSKMYNSEVFSRFIELCSHHHNLISEYFITPLPKKVYPLAVTFHSLPHNPCYHQSTSCLHGFADFGHAMMGFSSQNNILRAHPCCSMH